MAFIRWISVRKGGLGLRLALSLTLAMLPVGLLAVFESVASFKRSQNLQEEVFFGVAEDAMDEPRRRLNEAVGVTRTLGAVMAQAFNSPHECHDLLRNVVSRDARIQAAIFFDMTNRLACETGDIDPATALQVAARSGEDPGTPAIISGGATGTAAGRRLWIIEPVTAGGSASGWAMTVWPESYFVLANYSEGEADIAIADTTEMLFGASDRENFPQSVLVDEMAVPSRRLFEARSMDGAERQYVTIPLLGSGLTAIVALPVKMPPALGSASYLWTLSLPILMWGISLFVAFFSTNRLATGPLKRLERMASAMSEGARDLSELRLKGAPTELQCLSDRFVETAERIETYETNLEKTLADKSFLLKEVHHRVRNNLQLLVSILNMQERTAVNEESRNLLMQFRRRVFGLAAAHEALFGEEDAERGSAYQLIESAVRGALTVTGYPRHEPELDIRESDLPIDAMVPLALFVSEATATAVRHGEALGAKPRLRVYFVCVDGDCVMKVENATRAAATEDADCDASIPRAGNRLGDRLMAALSRQLAGKCATQSTGARYEVTLEFALRDQ